MIALNGYEGKLQEHLIKMDGTNVVICRNDFERKIVTNYIASIKHILNVCNKDLATIKTDCRTYFPVFSVHVGKEFRSPGLPLCAHRPMRFKEFIILVDWHNRGNLEII